MYTRPYDDKRDIFIPESYNGTAFREDRRSEEPPPTREASANPNENCLHNEEAEPAGSFFSKITTGNFLGNIFKNDKFSLQNIGTEEILIIATAAFLLFSKNGDKECAIMLLLVLFLY